MIRILTTSLFVFCAVVLSAQKFTKDTNTEVFRYMPTVDKQVSSSEFFNTYGEQMGLTTNDEMTLINESPGLNGYSHYKFKQSYKGVPIYGMSYALHTKGGVVKTAHGSYAARLELDTQPTLTAEEALQIAKRTMGAEEYPWEKASKQAMVNRERPVPELVIIDRALTKATGHYSLVYKIDLYSLVPIGGQQYFVDAQDGKIIKTIPLLHSQGCNGVPGRCETRYYGTRELIVDSVSTNNFLLFDETRGRDGLGVVDFDETFFSSESSEFDMENDGFLKGAMDAHLCTTKFYDALAEYFDWSGIDNQDGSLKIGVFAREQEDFVNAFWNGERTWIGNGNCNHGPLATMEVVGHEFMHGIIGFTSDLIYADESGAVNESFADVMGHALEYLEDTDNFNWELNSFLLNDKVEPFRIMDDPKRKEHPALYRGEYWVDGANVHVNSSIGNLLYVLLADGRQGANELGDNYDITGIGRLEAAQFLFNVNRNYLSPSSGYNQYYENSLLAAEEWFNGDQAAIDNLKEAWAYVGLPTPVDANLTDLSVDSDGFYTECGLGKYASTWFEITNEGFVDYLPENEAVVQVIEGFGAGQLLMEVPLSDSILVGETLRVTLDSILLIEDPFIVLRYSLLFPDDDIPGNDEEDDFISTTEFETNDISISLNTTEVSCFNSEAIIEYVLINRSCESIDVGTTVIVVISDSDSGVEYYTEEIVTTQRILPNARIPFFVTLPIQQIQGTSLLAEVSYEDDPNPGNNDSSADFIAVATTSSDYFNGFDDEAAVADGLGLVKALSFVDNVVDYDQ